MAQYYQVVDSSQNSSEDLQEATATYSNIVDGQGVHYILQTENEPQPYVLIDNINEAPVITQFAPQPVYLVGSPPKQQPVQSVPVVLNHTLQTKPLMQPPNIQQPVNINPPPPLIRHIQTPARHRPPVQVNPGLQVPQQILNNRVRTPRSAVTMSNVARMPRGMPPTRLPTPRQGGGLRGARLGAGVPRARQPNVGQVQQHVQQEMNGTMVKLEDGRLITMAEYKMFVEAKKLQSERRALTLHRQTRTGAPNIRQPRPSLVKPTVRPQFNPRPSHPNPRASMRPVRPPLPPPPAHEILEQMPMGMYKQQPTPPPPQPPAPKRTARIIQPNQSTRLPRVLREFCAPPEIKELINRTINDEEFENSIRMFVLLVCGEQRLITFTTPKEDCTIQEILEQVGVPLQPDTKIAISEINTDGINLVVSVGYEDDDEEDEQQEPDTTTNGSPERRTAIPQRPVEPPLRHVEPPPRPLTPVPSPEPPPRLIPGKMAVCTHCGYLSEDFNKCVRCKRKLPDGIKAVNSDIAELAPKKKPAIAINLKPTSTTATSSASASVPAGYLNKSVGNGGAPPNPNKVAIRKKIKPKSVEQEPMVVTLSSDDEDDPPNKDSKPIDDKPPGHDKEPLLSDLKVATAPTIRNMSQLACTTISCRTIRIGSYKFSPSSDVIVNGKEMIIKVPHVTNRDQVVTLIIGRKQIYKVLANFQKILPVVFYYLLPSVAEKICAALGMSPDSLYYYNPVAENEEYRRIVLLPTSMGEEDKWVFQTIYGEPAVIEELTPKEANTILLKTCPSDLSQIASIEAAQLSALNVRQLLIYPPGKGGISINSEDYMCLERDQFLNDVIIDFYLKYVINQMSQEQQGKVHVFSTFFYNRLTTKSARPVRKTSSGEIEATGTAAQKRHARVKNWTKNVDLFDKDYIVVPINENAHWFLAIICFPGMSGPQTFNGTPVKIEQLRTSPKKTNNIQTPKTTSLPVKAHKGNTALSQVEEDSDKDEAEGDDSELEVEESEEPATPTESVEKIDGVPIKQPCILIFDSLAGASRSRVVATLRDYLTCEYNAKKGTPKVFTKDVIHGACPKIPQQNNYTDCGLYLLQYVDCFFKDPIKDFRIPVKGLKEWFDEVVVTRKREDISNLIKELMIAYEKDINILPAIALPTQNGEPVENQSDEQDDDEMDESKAEQDNVETELMTGNSRESFITHPIQSSQSSNHSNSNSSESDMSSVSTTAVAPTATTSTSRMNAMSYLKAKRIHKVKGEGCMEETKKMKLDD